MYTEKERAKLLIQAATAVSTYPEVEGIVQVGSGVDGFGDQYSDIDLIFSTFSADQLAFLRTRVERMFADAVYIRPKPLPAGVFLYVFLKNGLEFDIVLLPTQALQVRSSHWKILTDKTGQVLQRMHPPSWRKWTSRPSAARWWSGSLRLSMRCGASCLRFSGKTFCTSFPGWSLCGTSWCGCSATMRRRRPTSLKDYRTLDEDFQLRLRGTYPLELARQPMLSCTQRLLQLFLKQHSDNQVWEIDSRMLDILKV